MHVVRIHQAGGPEMMRLDELPTPEPGPGQVRVRVEVAGVNFLDVYHRSGAYTLPLPLPLGVEGVGTVEALGPDVQDVVPGARVGWVSAQGSYATHALVATARLVTLPAGVSAQQAAAVLLQGTTAHYLSHATYPLQAGDVCLVHAAAGGVGQLLVQLAKSRGARVIGTVSTPAKAQVARQAGADEVILYSQTPAFASEVRRLTDGAGVPVVYDSVGRDTFDQSLASLRRRGTLVLFGQSSGAVPPFDLQRLAGAGSVYVTRPTLADYTATREELQARADDLFGWLRAGRLRLAIDRVYPLAQAAEAHRALEARETSGKLLLSA